MTPNWKNHIVSTPNVLKDKPRIKGTLMLDVPPWDYPHTNHPPPQ